MSLVAEIGIELDQFSLDLAMTVEAGETVVFQDNLLFPRLDARTTWRSACEPGVPAGAKPVAVHATGWTGSG